MRILLRLPRAGSSGASSPISHTFPCEAFLRLAAHALAWSGTSAPRCPAWMRRCPWWWGCLTTAPAVSPVTPDGARYIRPPVRRVRPLV